MNKKIKIIFLSIISVLLLPLLSYQAALLTYPLTESQSNTVNYLKDEEELRVHYNQEELSHLADVADVMKMMNYVFYALLFLFTAILIHEHIEKESLSPLLLYSGIFALCVFALILMLTLYNFEAAFTLFHRFFFSPESWIFPEDSALIKVFQKEFFYGIGKRIFIQALLLSAIMAAIGYLLKRRKKISETFQRRKEVDENS